MKQILLLGLLCFSTLLTAQQSLTLAEQQSVDNYFNGYNNQDFGQMRKSFHFVMKLVFTKKRLKESFSGPYQVFGKAKVVKTTVKDHRATILYAYAIDTTETEQISFAFSKKGRIMGMSAKSDKFRFVKDTLTSNDISDAGLVHQLDSIFVLKNKVGHFNGCVVVINGGKTIYEKCFGESNFETHANLNPQSLFELASVTKQFTATATLLLVQRGILHLTDDVQQLIPGFPYKGITIEHLLTHTSGLPEYEEMLEAHWDKTKIATNKDMVDQLIQYHPKKLFSPGKKYEYCNTGYALLSYIITQKSGLSYNDFLQKNIFTPLGMKRTQVVNNRRTDNKLPANYALGYVLDPANKKYKLPDSIPEQNFVYYLDGITGDGCVNSTVHDLALWDKALHNNTILGDSLQQKAFTQHKLSDGTPIEYGYGWEIINELNLEPVAVHSGSWPGYLTCGAHFLNKEKAVYILTNDEYYHVIKLTVKVAAMLNKVP